MSFVFVLGYIICVIFRPQDWVPVFYRFPIMDFLTGGSIFFLIFENLGAKKLSFTRVPQIGLLIGLFLCILMSHIAHTYLGGLIVAWNRFLPIFIIFFLLLISINTNKKYKTAIWLIVFLTLILVPQGVYQLKHLYGWAGQEITYDYHREEMRINWIGIFNDPNDLALLFVVGIGMLLPFVFGKTLFLNRLGAIASITALFYGVYMTNSRGGLVALVASLYFYLIKKTNRLLLGGIIGGVVAMGVFAIGPTRGALLNVEEASAFSRIELWYQGILMAKSNPIFGVGFDMFMEDTPQTAHNSYILALAELGFLGLFFWMALIYSSYKGLSLVIKHNEQLKTYAFGLQTSLVGFCVAAFFLSRTYNILPYMLFALSGSLLAITQSQNKDLESSFTRKDAGRTFWLSIAFIMAAYVLIKIAL